MVDDEILSYNFIGKLDKGVKLTSTFKRNMQDSSWYLAGTWKTNATKKYYTVTGKLNLNEEKDLASSKLFPHLEELNLANEVTFYKERKEGAPILRLASPEKIKTEYNTLVALERNKSQPLVAANEKQRTDAAPIKIISNESIPSVTIVESKSEKTEEPAETIASVEKPAIALPKTDLNVVDKRTTQVTVKEQVKDQAKNNPEAQEQIETISSGAKPVIDLPKTELNAIDKHTTNLRVQEQVKGQAKNTQPAKDAVVKTELPKQEISNKAIEDKNNNKAIMSVKAKVDEPVAVLAKQETVPTINFTEKSAAIGGRKTEFSQM